jgi:hypothetical protein
VGEKAEDDKQRPHEPSWRELNERGRTGKISLSTASLELPAAVWADVDVVTTSTGCMADEHRNVIAGMRALRRVRIRIKALTSSSSSVCAMSQSGVTMLRRLLGVNVRGTASPAAAAAAAAAAAEEDGDGAGLPAARSMAAVPAAVVAEAAGVVVLELSWAVVAVGGVESDRLGVGAQRGAW